ncbi:hypothetical protein HJC23_004458 [Cyclotella cryptica]|uniref:Alpha-type protein kinase domain-containing protein n=1 Tax=Cyclotella cryptica TaxID=29204 RepID=A0ABD3QF58_9STRA|eukprot:CCRYP_006072-RA/>CCRYP_006072-RA protein AED:0.30 eAED:0.30 QI:0/-1/0/1/-1/1/1/0/658
MFTMEAVFLPMIGEEESFEIIENPKTEKAIEKDSAEALLDKAKAKTAVLADEAEMSIVELQNLLGKTKTGTATRVEKDRLLSLNSKLSALKKDIAEAKTIEKDAELFFLHAKASSKVKEVNLAMREKDIRRALLAVRSAESVDLAFILDCTGSMGSYIASAKNSIRDIIKCVASTNSSMNLRLALVGYRDINDSKRFEVLDFVSSVGAFEDFLANLSADGGGDTPEDLAGAIQQANSLTWTQPSKVVFIIADAPCHGTEFHLFGDDSYPGGSPGIDIISELQNLQEKAGVQGTMSLTFGRILNDTNQMVQRFRGSGITIDEVGIEEASKLTKTVTASVRKSIFKTVTALGKPGASVSFAPLTNVDDLLKRDFSRKSSDTSLKAYTISPSHPSAIDWKRQACSKVKIYRNTRINDVSDLQEPLKMGLLKFVDVVKRKHGPRRTDKTFESTMLMRRAPSPFAEGEIRLAFHGQLAKHEDDLCKKTHAMVMKSFKHVGVGVNDRDQYLKQMEVSAIAHFLANEYNSFKPSHCKMVHVLPVLVIEEEDETNETSGNRRFCAEAPLPSGGTEFTKYSNNTGYWDGDHLDETLLRFTKYTYEVTSGYIIVTDLQGVQKGNQFYLTDPVILCKDILRFGNTNLGEKFIAKCIESTVGHLKENGWD